MQPECLGCGAAIEGRAPDARYCAPVCRRRAKERRRYWRKHAPSVRTATCTECLRTWQLRPGQPGPLPKRCACCIAIDEAVKALRRATTDSTQRPLERRLTNPRPKPARKPPRRFCASCGAQFSPRDRRHWFCCTTCRRRDHWYRIPVKQRQEKRRRQLERDRVRAGGLA